MFRAFTIAFALRMTYRINTGIYRIREVKFLRFLFRPVLYKSDFLKSLATAFAVLREIGGFLLGKALYFTILGLLGWFLSKAVPGEEGQCFIYAAMVMTLIGGLLNSDVIDTDMDTYYAVSLMRMDARKYTLSQYLYDLLRQVLGFLIGGGIVCLVRGLPLWVWAAATVFAFTVRLVFGALSVIRVDRRHWELKTDKVQLALLAVAVMLFAALVLPPILKVAAEWDIPLFLPPKWLLIAVCAGMCVPAVPAALYLFRFDRYGELCRKLLFFTMSNLDTAKGATAAASHSLITGTAEGAKSDKAGFDYLDELFVKRHRKLLWHRTKVICIVAGAVIIALCGALVLFPQIREGAAKAITGKFQAIFFVMYLINRGPSYTQALFANCDSSMLNYSFYREPASILKMFWLRLRDISLVNLPPALLIGCGLAAALLLTGQGSGRNCLLILISTVACMLFFTIHYLAIYYLLQPFTKEVAIKSVPYMVMNLLVYIVSYGLVQIDNIPFLPFAAGSILFSLAYGAIACLLAYKLAPKTFRIRKD